MSTLDRDAARRVIRYIKEYANEEWVLDALEGCIRPAPAQTIDRDALLETLSDTGDSTDPDAHDRYTRVVALLRSVDGVTLTRDEADFVHGELNDMLDTYADNEDPDEQQANRTRELLIAKLDAVQ